eukprot:SAG11_NODE_371_length_10051_cov_5.987741_14_plen_81_part_00
MSGSSAEAFTTVAGGVGELVLNRPERKNALSPGAIYQPRTSHRHPGPPLTHLRLCISASRLGQLTLELLYVLCSELPQVS